MCASARYDVRELCITPLRATPQCNNRSTKQQRKAAGHTAITKADITVVDSPSKRINSPSLPFLMNDLPRNKQFLVANIRDRGKRRRVGRTDGLRLNRVCLRVHGRYVSFCAGDDEGPQSHEGLAAQAGGLSRRQSAADRSRALQTGREGLDLMSDNDAKCTAEETPRQPPRRWLGCARK